MTDSVQSLKIVRKDYSSSPWRLVDERSEDVYVNEMFDHPFLGKTVISGPVCASTKQGVVDKVLAMLCKRFRELSQAAAKQEVNK